MSLYPRSRIDKIALTVSKHGIADQWKSRSVPKLGGLCDHNSIGRNVYSSGTQGFGDRDLRDPVVSGRRFGLGAREPGCVRKELCASNAALEDGRPVDSHHQKKPGRLRTHGEPFIGNHRE